MLNRVVFLYGWENMPTKRVLRITNRTSCNQNLWREVRQIFSESSLGYQGMISQQLLVRSKS